MRGRRMLVTGCVAMVAIAGHSTAVADESEVVRLTGHDAAHAAGQDGSASPAAATPVPLPDLGIAHRLGNGGINLFRMPLSELEEGYGEPQLVRRLDASAGWRFDRAHVLAGDFADVTPGDDGTADFVIWHALADGSIKVWAVGGGSDTRPRLMHTLNRRAGWNWATAHPVVGDVTGDGWDDLVVRRPHTPTDAALFVLPSDGSTLGAPALWATEPIYALGMSETRSVIGDLDADSVEDRVAVTPSWSTSRGLNMTPWDSSGTAFVGPGPTVSQDLEYFSYRHSRDAAGDVDGDGRSDVVMTHRSGSGGLYVFVHQSIRTMFGTDAIGLPQLWQSLGGSWRFDDSRQYMADTDGDYAEDLITVHRSGTGALLIWRHVSVGNGFAAPELVKDLRTRGWNWSLSRESVADTWGWFE